MIEEIAHSPGPWETWYDVDDDGFICQAGVDAGGDGRDVNVCMTTCENVVYEGDKDKWNAQIIADTELLGAALLLLEALETAQEIIRYLDDTRGQDPYFQHRLPQIAAALTRARRQPTLST